MQKGEWSEVTAIASRDLRKAGQAAHALGIAKAYGSYEELLADPQVEAIYNPLPNHLHVPWSIKAAEAGKHVLCEKPFAMNARQGQERYESAHGAGLTHATAFNWRFLPGVSRTKELIDEGFLGKIYHVNLMWCMERQADPHIPLLWRHQKEFAGFGVLGDIGPHVVDILRWLLGDFRKVSAHTMTALQERKVAGSKDVVKADAEDACAFIGEMASGAQVSVQVSRVAYVSNCQRIELYGSNGALVYHSDPKDGTWISGRMQGAKAGDQVLAELPIPERLREGLDLSDLGAAVGNFLFAQLARRFIQGVRTGHRVTPSFFEGVKSQEVLDAVVQSATEQRWVEI